MLLILKENFPHDFNFLQARDKQRINSDSQETVDNFPKELNYGGLFIIGITIWIINVLLLF